MHPGKLTGSSAAARTYHALLEHCGDWVDAGLLARTVQSDAIGTRVSEVRNTLAADPDSPYTVDPCRTVFVTEADGRRTPRQNYRIRLRAPAAAPSTYRPTVPEGELFDHPAGYDGGQ
jgi:hypothetical protein